MLLLGEPTTQPADPTMDWLLGQSKPATAPTTAPTSQPARVFDDKPDRNERSGEVTLSDGKTVKGLISSTPDKPLRLWDEKASKYIDIPFHSIASMEAVVIWEREEPEWRFKESGSDIKIFTGKSYPAHELVYKVTLSNEQIIEGGIVAPVKIRQEAGIVSKVLHKRDKGNVGQTLKDLVYIKKIVFAD